MLGQTPLTDQQRMRWAMLLAVAVHIVIVLAIGFRLYSPPPPQPVFSLNLALFQQAGGATEDRIEGVPAPPSQTTEAIDDIQRHSSANAQETLQQRLFVPTPSVVSAAADGVSPEFAPEPNQSTSEQNVSTAPASVHSTIGERYSSSRSKIIKAEDQTTPEGLYAEQWRVRVQQMGNRYFPDEAKANKLTGRLTLDVAVRSDGALLSIVLLKSSGSVLLDNAARRIVMLASPFEPFPESLRQQYDILHIVRTWEFDQGNRLRSER